MSAEKLGLLVLFIGATWIAVDQSRAFRRMGLNFMGMKRRRRAPKEVQNVGDPVHVTTGLEKREKDPIFQPEPTWAR